MRLYTVMHPPTDSTADTLPVALKDGFSWPAFFFGPLWLAWHRLWIAALAFAAVSFATLALPPAAGLVASFLLALLLGLEGNALRRWALRRRGWREAGSVAADSSEEALAIAGITAAP